MYVIVTSNLKLLECIKRNHGDVLVTPQKINLKKYNKEIAAITTSKKLAILAIIEGSKVYETEAMCGVIAIGNSNKDTIDMLIDELMEAIDMPKKHKGYEYIKYMIKCNVINDEYCLKTMTKEVYPECAKKFNVGVSTIAKHAQQIIKDSYNSDPLKYEALYYRNHCISLDEAPRVNNFVVIMANKIRPLIPRN